MNKCYIICTKERLHKEDPSVGVAGVVHIHTICSCRDAAEQGILHYVTYTCPRKAITGKAVLLSV